MAFLSNFDEDVFISYAHFDDDGPYATEPKSWVKQLHSDLEQRVKVHLGAQPSLWRDCEILNNEDFEKRILNRLVRTATFLSVISPSFFKRDWCLKELDAFAQQAAFFGISIDDDRKKRIFKVEKLRVDPTDLPAPLQGSGSYKFYGADEKTGKIYEYRPSLAPEFGRRYFEQMDELARDIAMVLKAMAPQIVPAPTRLAENSTVYLAETTSDLVDEANDLRRDLKARGYIVVPPGDLPDNAADLRAAASSYLARSLLSIHLVGRQFSAIAGGETGRSKVGVQIDLAAERAHAGKFKSFIWMPRDLAPDDDQQKDFIKQLWEGTASQPGTDVLQTSLDELKALLQKKLNELRNGPPPNPGAGPVVSAHPAPAPPVRGITGDPVRVYIICDQADYGSPSLLALKQFLFGRNLEPILATQGEDEKNALQEHVENLSLCDVALIYYGAGSEKWFNTKLMDFRKFLTRRERPVIAKAIYVDPKAAAAKSGVLTHEATVIYGTEPFTTGPLEPFVRDLPESQ